MIMRIDWEAQREEPLNLTNIWQLVKNVVQSGHTIQLYYEPKDDSIYDLKPTLVSIFADRQTLCSSSAKNYGTEKLPSWENIHDIPYSIDESNYREFLHKQGMELVGIFRINPENGNKQEISINNYEWS